VRRQQGRSLKGASQIKLAGGGVISTSDPGCNTHYTPQVAGRCASGKRLGRVCRHPCYTPNAIRQALAAGIKSLSTDWLMKRP